MERIAVIGAGTMGNGIAHVCSQHDLKVSLIDVKQEFLDRAAEMIKKNMSRELKKEKSIEMPLSLSLIILTKYTVIYMKISVKMEK